MIPKETIDKIFEAANIEDVVGDFVQLKKRGANMLGLCPFHNEKTPSFTVSPSKGIYKCFGCGEGGNSVNFIMSHEHYSYPEALKYLAKKYNIEIREEELTYKQIEESNEKESLYTISSFANNFFKQELLGKNGKKALKYLENRGYNEEIIKKFQIGYSPSVKDAFSSFAIKSSYKKNSLEKSGLSIIDGVNVRDRFRDRIMFPIHSFSGRILGFGGRVLSKENKVKYINSPESLIYQKNKILYGMFFAKKSIIKNDLCYIVEGYTDVISLSSRGVENVVSSSGTSLTENQIKLIRRFTKNITLLFDGDSAGIKASFRSIDMILSEGMNVNVVIFPDGEDPDSYSKKLKIEELQFFLEENSSNFVDFKKQILKPENIKDPSKKAKIITDIVSSISLIPDYLTKMEYVKYCSNLLNIDEKNILLTIEEKKNTVNRTAPLAAEKNSEKRKSDEPKNRLQKLELELLRILLNYGNENLLFDDEQISVALFIIDELEMDDIEMTSTSYRKLYEEIRNRFRAISKIDVSFFINHSEKEIASTCIDLISNEYSISDNWHKRHKIFTEKESDKLKQTVIKAILSLKIQHLEQRIVVLQNKLKGGSVEKIDIEDLKNLLEIKREIYGKLGRSMV